MLNSLYALNSHVHLTTGVYGINIAEYICVQSTGLSKFPCMLIIIENISFVFSEPFTSFTK